MSDQSISVEISQQILFIRGRRVMLDADLARIYRVSTKRLNEQVRRNSGRFPEDFVFRLTAEEKNEVVANCDHLKSLKYAPYLPYVFSEHGAVMLASVLNSSTAVSVSIEVVRAFVRFREMLSLHKDLTARLDALETKYDSQFKAVFDAFRGLMAPLPEPKRRIGFLLK